MTETKTRSPDSAFAAPACPSCGSKGRLVGAATLDSLLVEARRVELHGADGFRFCGTRDCDVVWYRRDGLAAYRLPDVAVRVGQKETADDRPICYCFGHTAADVLEQVARNGDSDIPDDIVRKCRQGLDRCEVTNPRGACCLGEVRRVVEEAQSQVGIQPRQGPDGEALAPGLRGATIAAVIAAVLSSACCWLPLLAVGMGASTAGLAGVFEVYRGWLLGAAAVLLGGAFWLAYRPQPECAPGSACEVPNPKLRRLSRWTLWVATVLVVVAAAFPSYVGLLVGGGNEPGQGIAAAAPVEKLRRWTLDIDGMTCEGCAAGLRGQLRAVPGVRSAEVSYPARTAVVTTGADQSTAERLMDAVKAAGYTATIVAVRAYRSSVHRAR